MVAAEGAQPRQGQRAVLAPAEIGHAGRLGGMGEHVAAELGGEGCAGGNIGAENFAATNVTDIKSYATEQIAPIDGIINVIYALLGLAIIVALVGVLNTSLLSIYERRREIGIRMAIGADRRHLREFRLVRLRRRRGERAQRVQHGPGRLRQSQGASMGF